MDNSHATALTDVLIAKNDEELLFYFDFLFLQILIFLEL